MFFLCLRTGSYPFMIKLKIETKKDRQTPTVLRNIIVTRNPTIILLGVGSVCRT